MRFILILLALICGVIATAKGFEWFDINPDQYNGWLAAALTLFIAAHLAPDSWSPGWARHRE